jgi:hypothetical protein
MPSEIQTNLIKQLFPKEICVFPKIFGVSLGVEEKRLVETSFKTVVKSS